MTSLIKKGTVKSKLNAAGTRILSFSQDISHSGLNEHKIITAPDKDILETKVRMQITKWNEKWSTHTEKETKTKEAKLLTNEAQKKLAELENLLVSVFNVKSAINWDQLKDRYSFKEVKPSKPKEPKKVDYPDKPDKNSPPYIPHLSLITKIFKSMANKRVEECEMKYEKDLALWEKGKKDADALNKKLISSHAKFVMKWESDTLLWEKSKAEFLEKQRIFNEDIDAFRSRYQDGDPYSILEYCKLVLNNSLLPECIKKDFEIDYIPENKILIVDYMLPAPEDLPRLKEVKYIKSKNELKESYHSASVMGKLYDATVYQLVLRVIHELFEADTGNSIDAVSLNGWVNYIDKATGKSENACIASIQVKKENFNEIDLRNVDPKACFKNFKGIGSSKLSGITPIQPILQINKKDRRFIQSYAVAKDLDSSTNIAAMDWEDFEHLIRELFEKEFSSDGGEVKVTQASRDGGVDAIAFDPDPIRGGKIVIQAKRYTNVVGVSAVRDLYGTVVNEGATKGILVTTADFGPDAYKFAGNKPLTLLNGGNLLHLLEKHGHKARIDIKEAKLMNKERD